MPRSSPNFKRAHGDGAADVRRRGPRIEVRRPARTQTSEATTDSDSHDSDSFSEATSFSESSSSQSSSMSSSTGSSSSSSSSSSASSDSGTITAEGASSSFESSTNPEKDRRLGYPMFDGPSEDSKVVPSASIPFAMIAGGKLLLYGRFEFRKVLGQGAFARVVEAFDTKCKEWIALKVFRASPKGHRSAEEEAALYEKLAKGGCVNHLQLLERVPHPLHSALVFPLLGPSLLDILKQQKHLSVPKVRTVVWSVLRCVASLTAMGMIHTDIKPENTLVTLGDKAEIIVIDFGNAEIIGKECKGNIQTRHYRAPEVIFGCSWGPSADLWSVGCLIPELLTGDCMFMPKDDLEHVALLNRVVGPVPTSLYTRGTNYKELVTSTGTLRYPCGKDPSYVRSKHPLHKVLGNNTDLLDLTKQLLHYDPDKRITARDALMHPFFGEMSF